MAEPNLKETAIWARQLAEELAKQGHPVRQLLAQARLTERDLQEKDARAGSSPRYVNAQAALRTVAWQ